MLKSQVTSLEAEKASLNARLDAVLQCTQQDRVSTNLSRLEMEGYMKQVEALKMSEGRLKREVVKLKQMGNEQVKAVAEAREKQAREMEENRRLKEEVKEEREKRREREEVAEVVKKEKEEISVKVRVLEARSEKMRITMEEQKLQIQDLKESVALKITVADDLQNILKQSQDQHKELKSELKQITQDKEAIMSKYFCAENLST